jgi:hypothetical protein
MCCLWYRRRTDGESGSVNGSGATVSSWLHHTECIHRTQWLGGLGAHAGALHCEDANTFQSYHTPSSLLPSTHSAISTCKHCGCDKAAHKAGKNEQQQRPLVAHGPAAPVAPPFGAPVAPPFVLPQYDMKWGGGSSITSTLHRGMSMSRRGGRRKSAPAYAWQSVQHGDTKTQGISVMSVLGSRRGRCRSLMQSTTKRPTASSTALQRSSPMCTGVQPRGQAPLHPQRSGARGWLGQPRASWSDVGELAVANGDSSNAMLWKNK